MENNFKKYMKWLLAYVLFIISLSVAINLLLYLPIPSASPIDSSHWLGFWGNFLGSLIACVPAFFALYESRRQSMEQHKENQTDRRLQVIPAFDISINHQTTTWARCENFIDSFVIDRDGIFQKSTTYDRTRVPGTPSDLSPLTIYFRIYNCGLGPALHPTISFGDTSLELPLLKIDTPYTFTLRPHVDFFKTYSQNPFVEFKFEFSDILENRYRQSCKFQYHFIDVDKSEAIYFKIDSIGQAILLEKNK